MTSLNAALHLLAAVVLLGSLIAGAITLSANARPSGDSEGDEFVRDVTRRSQRLAWTCLAVLAVTGGLMIPRWRVTWEEVASGAVFTVRFGVIVAAKVLGTVVLIAGVLFIKPTRPVWGRLQLLVGLGIVLLSVLLVR